MVVSVLIYIEGCEDVECMAKVYLPWNGCITSEDWEKVSSMDYGVHINDRHDPILVAVDIRFNDPYTVVGVRVVEGFAKLVNKCTQKEVISDFK